MLTAADFGTMTNRRLGIIKSEPSNYKNDIFPVTGKVGMSAGAANTRNGRRKKKNSPSNEGPTELIADVDASLPPRQPPRSLPVQRVDLPSLNEH